MMLQKKLRLSFLLILSSLFTFAQEENKTFNQIYQLLEKDNFFKAAEVYEGSKKQLSQEFQFFTEAILDNAFNRLQDSDKRIAYLLENKNTLHDTLLYQLYKTKADNALKQYQYFEAKNALEKILKNYKDYLSENDKTDYENSLKIWTALQNVAPQTVDIKQRTSIKMEKDLAGLNNLKVSVGRDTLNFIFDTGANISTTTQSVAKKLGFDLFETDIEVGTITGTKVKAQLGVCKKLTMGSIDIYNSVFLIMPDEALSFPQINYQILGILGYPIIEAFKEIEITKKGDFIIPEKQTKFLGKSNMAMKDLTPLIFIDQKHYTFDTGADQSMLYQSYYLENKAEVETRYALEKINFGGAGGAVERDGFLVDFTFTMADTPVTLEKIPLLIEKIKDQESVYGNIGQDLIRQFDTMIINFDQMFIQFK